MRRTSILVGVVAAGLFGSFAGRAAAAPGEDVTISVSVTAVCTATPSGEQTVGEFPVTLTVPRHVRSGSAFTAQLDIGFAVPPAADLGGAQLSASPGITPATFQFSVRPDVSSITATLPFTATGKAGATARWYLDFFGYGGVGPLVGSKFCVPTPQIVLAESKLVGTGKP